MDRHSGKIKYLYVLKLKIVIFLFPVDIAGLCDSNPDSGPNTPPSSQLSQGSADTTPQKEVKLQGFLFVDLQIQM